MADGIDFKVTGDKELVRQFKALEAAVTGRSLVTTAVAGALVVQNDAKRRVKKRTGTLSRSIHHEVTKSTPTEAVVAVGTDVEYGPHLEFGTGPHVIRPEKKKALWWPGAPHPVKEVHHPGTAAAPFLRPALDENHDAIRGEMAEVLDGQMRRAIKR